jgi:hypothetical protein
LHTYILDLLIHNSLYLCRTCTVLVTGRSGTQILDKTYINSWIGLYNIHLDNFDNKNHWKSPVLNHIRYKYWLRHRAYILLVNLGCRGGRDCHFCLGNSLEDRWRDIIGYCGDRSNSDKYKYYLLAFGMLVPNMKNTGAIDYTDHTQQLYRDNIFYQCYSRTTLEDRRVDINYHIEILLNINISWV